MGPGPAVTRAGERRWTIGLINDTPVDPNSASIWAGVNDVARERDANLICYPASPLRSPRGFDAQANVLFDLAGKPLLDGMVFWTTSLRLYCTLEETRDFFDRYDGLPIVSIACPIGNAPTVMMDNYRGMVDLVTHLTRVHACRRIALIGGPEAYPETEDRYRAYCDALSAHGIEVDPDLIVPGDFMKESARAAITLLLDERGIRPDAVVAMNDMMAIGAMEELAERGIMVPHEMPVVGFDDIDEASDILPPLTTVRQSFYEQGRTAAATLFEILSGEAVEATRILPAPVVIRQSCACLNPVVLDAGATGAETEDGIGALMAAGVGQGPGLDDLTSEAFAAFNDAMGGGTPEAFLRRFATVLEHTFREGGRISLWHPDLSAMRRHVLPGLDTPEERDRAENLFQQARVLIGETSRHASRRRTMQADEKVRRLNEVSQAMLSVFEREELLAMIARELPRLGIGVCFLSLYEDPASSTEWARLILAYDGTGRHAVPEEGIRFPSRLLVPEGMLPPDRRYRLIVEPLYFRDERIGLAVFDADPVNGVIYDTMRASISSALEGESLVRGLDQRSRELSAAYTDLQANQAQLVVTEKMASLGRLTAGIAHEMNTPLAAVRAAVKEIQQLVDEYRRSIGHPDVHEEDHRAIADDMARNLEIANSAAEKSAGFIRGIKAQTIDKKAQQHQAFPAGPVIRDTLSLLEFALRKGQCTLNTRIDDSIYLFGDPRSLSQVLTNTITNAVEACAPAGGTISVSFDRADTRAELRVSDTGCGIPPEVLPRVFDPLFTTKPFGEGTGLGLSILHDLVEEFNGTVRVESRPGDTTFSISFPVDRRNQ